MAEAIELSPAQCATTSSKKQSKSVRAAPNTSAQPPPISSSSSSSKESGNEEKEKKCFLDYREIIDLGEKLTSPYHMTNAERILYEQKAQDDISSWLRKGNAKKFSEMPWFVPGAWNWSLFCPGWIEGEVIEDSKRLLFFDPTKEFSTEPVEGEANWRNWGAFFRCTIAYDEKDGKWHVAYKNIYRHLSGEMHGVQLQEFISDFEYEDLYIWHRIFITLETPHSSKLSYLYSCVILGTILLTIITGILSTSPDYRYTPSTCATPACFNDALLCPNSMICEPQPLEVFASIDLFCLSVFAIDYLTRLLLVSFVSPRLADLVTRQLDKDAEKVFREGEALLKDAFNMVKAVEKMTDIDDGFTIKEGNDAYPKTMHGLKLGVSLNWIRLGHCELIKEDVKALGFRVEFNSKAERESFVNAHKLEKPSWIDQKDTLREMPQPVDQKWGRIERLLRYFFSLYGLIDLCAVLPLFVALGLGHSITTDATVFIRVARAFRLVRFFRFFDTGTTSGKLYILRQTISESMETLVFLLVIFLILAIIFAFVIFAFERGTFQVTKDHPQGAYIRLTYTNDANIIEESPFRSLSSAIYFTIISMTTVGYGDLVATSSVGRFVSNLAALIGILVIAFPTTILNQHFSKEYEQLDIVAKLKKSEEENLASELRKQKEASALQAKKPEDERKKTIRPSKIFFRDVVEMVIKDAEAKDEEEKSIALHEKQEEEGHKKNGPRSKWRKVGRAVVALQRMAKPRGEKAKQDIDAAADSQNALAMGGGGSGEGIGGGGGEELGFSEEEQLIGENSAGAGGGENELMNQEQEAQEEQEELSSPRGVGLGQFFNEKTGEELALNAMFDHFNESMESHQRGDEAFVGLEKKYGAGWSEAVIADLRKVQSWYQDAIQKQSQAREAGLVITKQLTELYYREKKTQHKEEEERRAKVDDNRRHFEEQASINLLARSRSL